MATKGLSKSQQDRLVRHLESQGCRVTPSKKGFMVFAPNGESTTIHTSASDYRAQKNLRAWFRRNGIHHPDDPKEMDEVVEKNDEGYPLYLTKPITSTTRNRILKELERQGWPPRTRPMDLQLDTGTAGRALYNVGYRWEDPTDGGRNRWWKAPDEIIELHEKVKQEMKEREEQARRERALRALPKPGEFPQQITEHVPVVTKPAADVLRDVREAEGRPLVEVPFIANQDEEVPLAPEDDLASPEPLPTAFMDRIRGLAKENPPAPEREFIDSVDSWTVNTTAWSGVPQAVIDYLLGLRAAGLEAEIRVWRKPTTTEGETQ